jgi:outer membrane protein TolC
MQNHQQERINDAAPSRLAWIAALSALTLLSAVLGAVPALSLDAALQEGLREAPALRAADAQQDAARAQEAQSLAGLLPSVRLEANHAMDLQYQEVPVALGALNINFPVTYPHTDFSVEADEMLFDGFASLSKFQAQSSLSQASRLEVERKAFEVAREIELDYDRVLAAQQFSAVAKENLDTVATDLARAQARLDSGVSTPYDLLRVQALESEARAEVQRRDDDVVIARQNLARAMGLASDDRPVEGVLPAPSKQAVVQALAQPAPEQRADLQAAQLKAAAAGQEAAAALGSLLPSLVLSARWEEYDNTDQNYPGQGDDYHDAYDVGLVLRWDILDGGRSLGRAREAAALKAQAQAALQEKLLDLPADFNLWRRRYLYSASDVAAKQADQDHAQESLRIAQAGYQSGTKTVNDTLDAEADLFRARSGVVEASLAAQEALIQLELTLGKEI